MWHKVALSIKALTRRRPDTFQCGRSAVEVRRASREEPHLCPREAFSRTPDPVLSRSYLWIDAEGFTFPPSVTDLPHRVERILSCTRKQAHNHFWQIHATPRGSASRALATKVVAAILKSISPARSLCLLRSSQTFQRSNKSVTRHLTNTANVGSPSIRPF